MASRFLTLEFLPLQALDFSLYIGLCKENKLSIKSLFPHMAEHLCIFFYGNLEAIHDSWVTVLRFLSY